ncbi:MAG: M23 family metallopeptidase [Bacteroidales bacterium]|jgi:hypothetical protein|nr:M23 family metallopeptidase [Bacteroidales bacterium]
MSFIRILLTSLLILNGPGDDLQEKPDFIPPVKIPMALSANFGELRIDHFHAGIDIKTQGVTGKEVVAAATGHVYRISVTPNGFGKALYLRHSSGYSTVYAHLDRFPADIEEYVTKSQYEKKSFAVSLFPPADMFRFSQGEVIAWSGNSGGSSGPHLHYEIRKSDTEEPVNPLLFNFGPADDIRPVIERLVIYPADSRTQINGRNSKLRIQVSGGNGNYVIPSENEIRISGPAGFGFKSYDLLNDNYNRCAVYSVEMKVDSVTRFRYRMDKFAFSESRYINSHVDYEAYMKEKVYYERTFVLPGNRLPAYHDVINRGIFNFSDSRNHKVEIILEDAHGNRSTLRFNVISEPPSSVEYRSRINDGIPMVYNRSNRFRADNITLTIPSGALYDTLYFRYGKEAGTPQMYSDLHLVHDIYTPLHKAYTISIKPNSIPEGLAPKMLIVQKGENQSLISAGGKWTEDFLTAEVQSFGAFYIGIDTVPPAINANGLSDGADLSGRKDMRVRITDDLSGIKGYTPEIDGKWALFEYDQKNNVLIYRFDPEYITSNSNHTLTLKVTDNRDNESVFRSSFYW